jgi:hypothetical protein
VEDVNPKWATSQVQLAAILGVTRQTINNWKRHPGCPGARANGQYLVEEWIGFVRDTGLECGDDDEPAISGKGALEEEKLRLQNAKLRIELDRERARVLDRETTATKLRELIAEASTVLRSKFEVELPPRSAGRPATEICKLNKAAIDEVLVRLNRGAEKQELLDA